MLRIGLLRHAPTAWNDAGRLQGRTDVPLTPVSVAALEARALPDRWQGARVVASPLSRAHETARVLCGAVPETDPRLVEMHFGDWEGLHGRVLGGDPASGIRAVADWGWDYGPTGGETPRAVLARASEVLAHIAADGRETLIVSHLVVMRVLLARAHEWDFLGPAPFRIERDHIYELTLDSNGTLRVAAEPVRLIERGESVD